MIALADLSALNSPPSNWLMAVLKAYFDDSGDETNPNDTICSLGGYVGTVEAWQNCEIKWIEVLRNFGLPYLHMADFNAYEDAFAPLRGKDEDRRELLRRLIMVIRDCKLAGIMSVIRLTDLRRFCETKGIAIDAYALNLYVCMAEINRWWPQDAAEVWLDRVTKPHLRVAKAIRYAQTDPEYAACAVSVAPNPLPPALSFKNVPAIQAADFLAWESRKDILFKDDWFASRKSGDDFDVWMRDQYQWAKERGANFPHNRRSFDVLVRSSVRSGYVWSTREIGLIHNFRRGIWPS